MPNVGGVHLNGYDNFAHQTLHMEVFVAGNSIIENEHLLYIHLGNYFVLLITHRCDLLALEINCLF